MIIARLPCADDDAAAAAGNATATGEEKTSVDR